MADPSYGDSPDMALRSCQHLYAMGVRRSGVYFLKPDAPQSQQTLTTYCDMETQGGGWAMVYNSVLGTNTIDFWNIPYAERLGRRGRPSLDSNFYEGNLYLYRKTEFADAVKYMDVVEDLSGKTVVLVTAKVDGFDASTMRFQEPQFLNGNQSVFNYHIASGWSAPDYDGDTYWRQCANWNSVKVTQHYHTCWNYNLGADFSDDEEGGPELDAGVGPHLVSHIAATLGLATDGTRFTRVRRITRFVRW